MALKENNIKTNIITKLNKLDFNSVTEIADPNGTVVTKVKTDKDTSTAPSSASNTKATVSKPAATPMGKPSVPGTDLLPVVPSGLEDVYIDNDAVNKVLFDTNYDTISKKNITSTDKKFGIFDKKLTNCDKNDFLKKNKANRNNNKKLINKTNPKCVEETNVLDNAITTITKVDTNANVAKVSINANLDKFIKNKLTSNISNDLIGKDKLITSIGTTAKTLKNNLIKNSTNGIMNVDLKSKLLNTITGCGPGLFDKLLSPDISFNADLFKGLFNHVDCDSTNSALTLAESLVENGSNPKAVLTGLVSSAVDSKNNIGNLLNAKKFSVDNNISTPINIQKEGSILNSIGKGISDTTDKIDTKEIVSSLDKIIPTWNKDKDGSVTYHKVKNNKVLVANSKKEMTTKPPEYNSDATYTTSIDDINGMVISSAFV